MVKYSPARTKRSISDSLLYWRSLFLTLDTVVLNIFMETTMVSEKVTAIAMMAMVAATPRLIFLLMGLMAPYCVCVMPRRLVRKIP